MTQEGVKDRVVIVTGAGRGIGRGIAHHLARRGARLCISDKVPERIAQVSRELDEIGAEHLAQELDVRDRDAVFAMVEETVGKLGRVEGIVTNAQSLRPIVELENATPEHVEVLLDGGPKATLWSMQAVFPHMRDQGWGRIVNVASSAGILGAAGYGPYNAAKEAIRALTRTAAQEWGKYGIIVNCYCPASTAHRKKPEHEMGRQLWESTSAAKAIGRDGDPEHDIAPVVEFLLSDACRYMTGQTLMIDGGSILRA